MVNVDELLNGISSAQFRKWQAWFRVRRAEEWRVAARISASIFNAMLMSKGITDPESMFEPECFIPKQYLFEKPPAGPNMTDVQSALAAAYGPKY